MFLANFLHEITLYAVDIDKKRFMTPLLTLLNHFGKSDLDYSEISATSEILSETMKPTTTQSGRKCVSVAVALSAEQGP